MSEPIISVIIPVYNRDNNIADAIESVVGQTCKNWELILVDDGSKDRTAQICQKYAEKDCRIRYFFKKNGGVSSARNLGIQNAIGKYILFLDSDDLLEQDAISILEDNILANPDIEILCFGTHTNTASWRPTDEASKRIDYEEIKNDYLPTHINIYPQNDHFLLNYVWNKCYRTSFIMQYDLKFDEARQTWEDGLFIINCLKNATSVLLISDVLHCGCADPTVEHLSGNLYDTQLSMYISDETNYKQWFEQRYNFNSQHYARSNFNVINMLCSQTVKRYGKKARGILNDAVKAPIVKFWIHNVVPKDKTEEKIISAIAREDADRLYRLYSITLPRRVLRKLKSIF